MPEWLNGTVSKTVFRFNRNQGSNPCLSAMKPVLINIARFIQNLRRPTKRVNKILLQERGEDLSTSFIIREATEKDINALSHFHVKTWSDTYPAVRKPPTFEIREWQWRDQFAKKDNNWF